MNDFSLAGTTINRYFHVCGFFNSRDEQYEVLGPFYKEAIARSEKLVTIINPRTHGDHVHRLGKKGIDAEACSACGQLDVLGWDEAYLKDGQFDQFQMLQTVEAVFAAGRAAGFANLRITGEMGWALESLPGTDQLLEYEARVNNVLARNRQPAICIYDTAHLSGSMLMDILRAHPLTIVSGVVHENPFFVEPEQLLKELAQRRAAKPAPAALQ